MGVIDPIRVEGLRELKSAMAGLGAGAPKALRLAMNRAVEDIAAGARRLVPTKTGAARSSIKAASTATGARVAAGSKKAPYYPWLDYGGRVGRGRSIARPWRPEGRYLYPTYRSQRDELVKGLEREIGDVARQAGLKLGDG